MSEVIPKLDSVEDADTDDIENCTGTGNWDIFILIKSFAGLILHVRICC